MSYLNSIDTDFHKSEDQFKKQKMRDKEKERLCEENSIKLIVIPYHINSDSEKIEFIRENLTVLGIEIINRVMEWKQFYKGFNPLEELQSIARDKGGRCLSEEYRGIDEKLKWECEHGHVWETAPYYIRNGSWCQMLRSGKNHLRNEGNSV